MSNIQVNFEAVNTRLSSLRNHIITDITQPFVQEYRQLQNNMREVDGLTAATISQAMEANQRKAAACASAVERLVSFMENSSRQIELADQRIARAINTIRKG